jgi:hypothetical protein
VNRSAKKTMLFISRHDMTDDQDRLAYEQGYLLTPVGDFDAFSPQAHERMRQMIVGLNATAVACVHPWLALMASGMAEVTHVGVFENSARAAEGEKPSFAASKLHLFPTASMSNTIWEWVITKRG